MFPYLSDYLPTREQRNDDFIKWLGETENLMESFAALIMFVLPGDRLSYYETSNVSKMREQIY